MVTVDGRKSVLNEARDRRGFRLGREAAVDAQHLARHIAHLCRAERKHQVRFHEQTGARTIVQERLELSPVIRGLVGIDAGRTVA